MRAESKMPDVLQQRKHMKREMYTAVKKFEKREIRAAADGARKNAKNDRSVPKMYKSQDISSFFSLKAYNENNG